MRIRVRVLAGFRAWGFKGFRVLVGFRMLGLVQGFRSQGVRGSAFCVSVYP